jgi:protein pelota
VKYAFNEKKSAMTLTPQDPDDLWTLYNLIQPGDKLYAKTSRIIKIETDGIRPTEGKRLPMFLGIEVEKTAFRTLSDNLRVTGIVIEAPEKYAVKGSHHTITLSLKRSCTLMKDHWYRHDLELVKRSGQWKTPPIYILAVDDDECSIALLSQNNLDIITDVNGNLPRKREVGKREKAQQHYFNSIISILNAQKRIDEAFLAIIGPGFIKDALVKYLKSRHPLLFQQISVIGSASSGGVGGIKEALRSGVLDKATKQVRIVEESKAVSELLHRLGNSPETVTYGLLAVQKAVEYGAANKILISSKLLREVDPLKRRDLEALLRQAENMGGRIMIIGHQHEAGEQLLSLGGIAAELRYAIDLT